MYAKLNEGVLEYAPVNYTLTDGRVIVNFNKSITLMAKYGFKEVLDNQPIYNQDTEYLVISNYTETETNIVVNYVIKTLTPQEPTLEERIASVEEVILNLL